MPIAAGRVTTRNPFSGNERRRTCDERAPSPSRSPAHPMRFCIPLSVPGWQPDDGSTTARHRSFERKGPLSPAAGYGEEVIEGGPPSGSVPSFSSDAGSRRSRRSSAVRERQSRRRHGRRFCCRTFRAFSNTSEGSNVEPTARTLPFGHRLGPPRDHLERSINGCLWPSSTVCFEERFACRSDAKPTAKPHG